MRELLGGKGAGVAEMTRVLGVERVPAGFTITTEACVAYMKADQTLPGRPGRGHRRGGRPAGGAGGQEARRQRRPAARVRALGGQGIDARDDGHGPQPGPERRVGGGPGPGDRERALRLGLLPSLRADVRQRLSRDRGRALRGADRGTQVGGQGRGRHRARRRRPQGAHGLLPRGLRRGDRRRLPAGPTGAAHAGHPRRVRLLERKAGGGVPPAQPHPRRVGNRGERAADGVRQQGRHLGQRRRLLARRGDGRADAQRRLPAQRAGRGRGLGRAHPARPARDEGA